ncbi:SDR family oxidoreductase [Rhodococcus jostii]|uniref:NAD(P)H-binding protein n=1 Tax=Rhodococcus jostii TaxID=132919 RepID=A0ABU4CTA2_RHOJO|nr:NAD(P)H-binding protein [Rhodococcus jostii]MDV6286794.1 NAD(P)H-binding protein [Rhodococcus jostii]
MSRILVTGASGNAARHLPGKLLGDGHTVRVLLHTSTIADLDPRIETVVADLSDPRSVRDTLTDIDEVFLITVDEGAAAFAEAATHHPHLRRLVLLSSKAVSNSEFDGFDNPIYRKHLLAEQHIATLPIPTTVLRPGGLASNALRWVPGIRDRSQVQALFPELAAPLLDPEDLASVAALIFADTGDHHAGQIYTLTGPDVVTVADQVAILSEVLERAIDFVQLTEAQALEILSRTQPAEFVNNYIPVQRRYLTITPTVHDTVPSLLGRPARTFRDWAIANRARFN